jgi:hypothetical protein
MIYVPIQQLHNQLQTQHCAGPTIAGKILLMILQTQA